MKTILCYVCLLGMPLQLISQITAAAHAEVLTADSSSMLGVPAFTYGENSQCDKNGNLYFHATAVLNDSRILKLGRDGSTTLYTLPENEASSGYFQAFRVSPGGRLRILTRSNTGDYVYIYRFTTDLTSPNKARIALPTGLNVTNFLVLPSGNIVLQGYFTSAAAQANLSHAYFGMFDPSGQLIRSSLEEQDKKAQKKELAFVPSAAVAQTDDAESYVLDNANVDVLNASGDLTDKIKIPSPDKGFDPVNIFATGNYILIVYFKHDTGATLHAAYALLDRGTDKLIRFYVPDKELGNNLACFSNNGFTFLRYERGRVKLIHAQP